MDRGLCFAVIDVWVTHILIMQATVMLQKIIRNDNITISSSGSRAGIAFHVFTNFTFKEFQDSLKVTCKQDTVVLQYAIYVTNIL